MKTIEVTVTVDDSKAAAAVVAQIASKKTFEAGVAMYCDLINDGSPAREKEVRLSKGLRPTPGSARAAENVLIGLGLLRREDAPSHVTALAFQAAVKAVKLSAVPVIAGIARHDRKTLAAAVRKLFTRLGFKGASVTTPDYSMASGVEVALPKRADYRFTDGCNSERHPDCAAHWANQETSKKIEEILLHAFPGTDDRSDSRSDYFNFVWSIN